MNKRIMMLMATALALLSASSQVTFSGGDTGMFTPQEIVLSNNHSSLNKIYVLHNTDGVSMTFNSSTGERARWENYDEQGASYPSPISGIRWDGMGTTLDRIIPNIGYIITEGTTPFYCWVVNYADYEMELNGMSLNNEAPCDLLTINIDGHAAAIPYYEINGVRQVLDREIKLTYNTLVWNEDEESWGDPIEVVDTFPALDQGVEIVPPLCNTSFLLKGDRFLKVWPTEQVADSIEYQAKAVNCVSTAYYLDDEGNYLLDDHDNKMKLDGELSGGSAPVRILFTGYPTDGVAYRLWEIARDQDFEDVILQFYQDEVDYTFMDAGNYYVRYMVANDDGSCKNYADTYTINVSESSLGLGQRRDLPNVLSPGSVWKVPHKSIVEFHCWIFNRWGNLVYEFTDPEGGWDGTYRGKPVDTGVYYCLVTALGSDGVKYKLRGDISILRYSKLESTGGTEGGN